MTILKSRKAIKVAAVITALFIIFSSYTTSISSPVYAGEQDVIVKYGEAEGNLPYKMRVKVTLGSDGRIIKVEDFGTNPKAYPENSTAESDVKMLRLFIAGKGFDKYIGKNLEEVKKMEMQQPGTSYPGHPGVDAVSGATACSIATRSAVLDAMENNKTLEPLAPLKKSTLFVSKQDKIKETFDGYKIELDNSLPEDYQPVLENITYGIFNGNEEDIVKGASLSEDGRTITINGDLKPGHYFINISDKGGKYPSFNSKWAAFDEYSYPYFHYMNNDPVKFVRGKLQSSSMTTSDLLKNIEEIEITYQDGQKIYEVPFRNQGSDFDGKFANEQYKNNQLFTEDGKVNLNFKKDGVNFFQDGKKYKLHVHFWNTTAVLETPYDTSENTKYDDALVKYGYSKETGSLYDIKLKVTLNSEGNVKSVEDYGTVVKNSFQGRWKTFKDEKKGFEAYKGKSLKEINEFKPGESLSYPYDAIAEQVKTAVIDALTDGAVAQPEKLTKDYSFTQKKVNKYESGYKIYFDNKLPSSYDVKVESVYYGPKNKESKKIENFTFDKKKNILSIKGNLLPGIYFVNITDGKGKYGPPIPSTNKTGDLIIPVFIISAHVNNWGFDKEANRLTVKGMDIEDAVANLAYVADYRNKVFVGALDDKGEYNKSLDENPLFLADGRINFAAKKMGSDKYLFETGKKYEWMVLCYGMSEYLQIKFTAPDIQKFEKIINAENEISSYVDLKDYRESEQNKIKKIIANGKEAVNKADNEDSLRAAVADAKAKLDEVKTDEKYKAEELKAAKDEAAVVDKKISDLGEKADIKISDAAKIENVRAELNNLSDLAKEQLTNINKLDELTDEIRRMKTEASFKFEEVTPLYKKGEMDLLKVRMLDADIKQLISVCVDNKKIDRKYYTVKKGSIIVELKKEFMDTLSNGKHTLRVNTDKGYGEIIFKVETAANKDNGTSFKPKNNVNQEYIDKAKIGMSKINTAIVKTGDEQNVELTSLILIFTGCVLSLMLLKKGKKNK